MAQRNRIVKSALQVEKVQNVTGEQLLSVASVNQRNLEEVQEDSYM